MTTEEIVQNYQVKLQFASKYPKVMENTDNQIKENEMEEYDVNVRVELFDIVKAHNEEEAVKIVEEKLLKDQSLLMDNLEFEVNEA